MLRPKTPPNLTLQEHLSKYDTKVLQGALQQLEDSLFWDIFKAYLKHRQREFEVASLDLACHTNMQAEAAKASGIACALEEVADKYCTDLHQLLSGYTGVVENPSPEEE